MITAKKNRFNVGFCINRIAVLLLFMLLCNFLNANGALKSSIPTNWIKKWQSPSADLRPLQLVHDMDLRNPDNPDMKVIHNKATYLRDSCGLGGVVCNVMFGKDYLKSEAAWKQFVDGVRFMRENKLRVWIYDEDGYPSLSAGGRVLEGHPELESVEMVYDKGHIPLFYTRPSYEFTHASNNFAAARRYPNPLDKRSTERFIEVTHKNYFEHLGNQLYSEVEAFFTDEPSLMAVSLGQLGEEVRNKVRVQDPVDETKKSLPAIPWVDNLPEKYKQKYNEELLPHLLSLFEGNSASDKEIRQKFWSLTGETDKSYYYDAIQNWCKSVRINNEGPVSSGHGLREESLIIHVPVDGNKMQALSGLDIPGLDFLDSDPKAWMSNEEQFSGNWQAAALPTSVAQLTGKRRVMCEMSDFLQTMSGNGPATLAQMEASTAWQMAWGVTEFTLYYTIRYGAKFPFRNESTYKAYCDFVGRINAIIRNAQPVKGVLLYYPICDMQREYLPTATPVGLNSQNEKVQQIEKSFNQIGSSLAKAQIPFVLIDYLFLEKVKVTNKGTILIGDSEYNALILPQGVQLPPTAEILVNKIKAGGIKVLTYPQNAQNPTPEELTSKLNPAEKLLPERNEIAFGKFIRSGHDIFLLVNSGAETYGGHLTVQKHGVWTVMDPQTSKVSLIRTITLNGKNVLPIRLESNQTLVYVSK